jgi:hypothetical protein
MNDMITVGAASLMSALILATISGRWFVRPEPSAKHRAPANRPLLRPVEALDRTSALCSSQGKVTHHARTHITRQLICMECHSPSPDWITTDESGEGVK